MSYSRKVYVKAASALERRRSKAERTQSMHREEAYAKIPELISKSSRRKILPPSSAARISSKKTVIPRIILTRTIPARNAAIRGLSAA